jgi:Uma2 family endonuclease
MSTAETHFVTEREYLELERRSEIRSEYLAGRIYAMSGASRRHNLVALNLAGELRAQLRGRPCEAYVSDMRVKVSPTRMYTYPDVVALCGEPRFEDTAVDTLLNPSVIIEVLSTSTESYDRGEKFFQYRRIETLREYVLVAQSKMRVEHYRREGEHWILTEISTPDGILELSSINCRIELPAIYEKVDFPAPAEE